MYWRRMRNKKFSNHWLSNGAIELKFLAKFKYKWDYLIILLKAIIWSVDNLEYSKIVENMWIKNGDLN